MLRQVLETRGAGVPNELVCMCSNTQSPSNSVRLTVRPAVRTSCVTLIFSTPQSRGTARTCPCLLTMRCRIPG